MDGEPLRRVPLRPLRSCVCLQQWGGLLQDRTVQVIELSGGPAVGKTTVVHSLARDLSASARVLHLQHRWIGPDYRYRTLVGLAVRHLPVWLAAFGILARAIGMRPAGTRVGKYLVHLWRRREEVRSGRFDVLLEDEAFISWAASDLAHAPAFAGWLEKHAALLYPDRVGAVGVTYDILPLHCSELVRVQRILRRRLGKGPPSQAARRTRKNGLRTGSWRMEGAARRIVTTHAAVRLVDPLGYPSPQAPRRWGQPETTSQVLE